jgi:hypothetical protein
MVAARGGRKTAPPMSGMAAFKVFDGRKNK